MPTLQEHHFGVITNNKDPEQRGRLKVKCQSLVGADYELPDWIEPAGFLWSSKDGAGMLFVPESGSTVELIVDAHDSDFDDMPGERFLQNPNIRWRPATATDKKGPMPVPEALRGDYPNTRGFVTKSGHQVLMNDKTKELTIKAATGSKIVFKANGDIEIDAQGKVIMNGANTAPVVGEGVVVGTGIDSFTGSTYNILGSASTKVFAKK